jgi:hypothetical protein
MGWERRENEAWNALARRGLDRGLWVHMLRGLALCGDQWPFASADSTNVAVNYSGDSRRGNPPVCPERMARLIDGRRNSPIRWTMRGEQQEMFVA